MKPLIINARVGLNLQVPVFVLETSECVLNEGRRTDCSAQVVDPVIFGLHFFYPDPTCDNGYDLYLIYIYILCLPKYLNVIFSFQIKAGFFSVESPPLAE